MKAKKRLTAVLILIAMIFSNFIFPLQGIVYAVENKTINIQGYNNFEVNEGSVSFDWYNEGVKSKLTFTLYNSENQKINAVLQDPNDALFDLQSTSYEGFYFIVSSDNVSVQELKFEIVGNTVQCSDESGRLNLPTEVEHISFGDYNVKSIYEKKEVRFESDNLVVNQDGSVDVYCDVEYNSGIVNINLFNSDGTQAETIFQGEGYCTKRLNTTTYEGSYVVITSNTVRVSELKLEYPGEQGPNVVNIDETGKAFLPERNYNIIDSHSFRDADEKKEVYFHSEDNLQLNEDGSVDIGLTVDEVSGIINVTPYNYDDTKIKVRNYDKYDDQAGEWGIDYENAFGKVNGTTYEGAYLIVDSDDFDLSEFKFSFSGVNEGIDCYIGEGGRVELAGCEFVHIDNNSFRYLHERKRVEFRSDSLVFNNDGTVSLETEIEGNEGPITFEVHNSDGNKVNITKVMQMNDVTGEIEPDDHRGEALLNTSTYEGAYLVVTASNNADLSDIILNIAGNDISLENGIAFLPANAEWISIESWSFSEKTLKAEVSFSFDNIQIENGVLTAPCNIKNNTGSINFELHNSDNTKVNIKKCIYYDFENGGEYESDSEAFAKLNTTTYEGAYFILSSNDVDLSKVKLKIAGQDIQLVKDGNVYKATLGEAEFMFMDKYSIKDVNPAKVNVTVNATSTGGNIAYLQINDVVYYDEGGTNSINITHEVEDSEEDRIMLRLEDGKIITNVRLNDMQEDITEQNTGWLDFDFPHSDTYTIEITCAKDPYYLPSIMWFDNAEIHGEENILKNGTIEIVSVKLADGQTIYDHDELLPVDDPGIGMHPQHDEAYLREEAEYGYHALYAQEGSTVTIKIIPNEGYEVSNLNVDDDIELVADQNVTNQYTFVMPETGEHVFKELITKTGENPTYFDVTDPEFGAIPNDEIDDSYAINAALNQARNTDETITVYVPAGNYIISESLIIYSNTKLILDENAVIKSISSEDESAMVYGMHNDLEDTHGGYTRIENIEISGGTWDKNSRSDIVSSAFILRHGKNINIHDLTVKNCTDHMINVSADKDVTIKNVVLQNQIPYTGNSSEFWGSFNVGDTNRYKYVEAIHTDFAGQGEVGADPLDNTVCDNITIDNCRFEGVFSGVGNHHESNYKTKNVTVKNSEFINLNYGEAVNAWSFDSLTFTGNTLTGSIVGVISVESTGTISNNSFTVSGAETDYGVLQLEDSIMEITNNTIKNASKFLIRVDRGAATISENTLEGSATEGIKVENATNLQINNNTISNIGRYPIFIKNCTGQNVVSENTITAPSNLKEGISAILVEKSGNNNTINNNNISGIFDYDIYVIESNASINNNILNSCKVKAISVDNSTVTINNNRITNTNFDAIHLNGCNSTVTSNTITNTSNNAIYTLNGKTTISNNEIDTTGVDAIRIDNLSEVIVNNNILKNVKRYGIYVTNTSSSTKISSNEINGADTVSGIFINGCKGNNTIEKNTIKSGSYAGIFALKCSGTISENNVTGCSGDALQTSGDEETFATFTISNNTLITSSNSNYDIRLNPNTKDCVLSKNTLGTRGLKAESGVTYTIDEFTGLKEENGNLVYYRTGIRDTSTGLIEYKGTWYYIKNGVVDKNATTLVEYKGKWFYIQNGILVWGVRTLVEYKGTWYYINNSSIDWSYNGVYEYKGNTFYIQGGTIKWGVKGLTCINDIWYYLDNSIVQKNYTGLVEYKGNWFYVQKGILKWGEKTLVQYNNTWFYVNNSMIDWNYTGLAEYRGTWFYIQSGILKWGAKTLVQYNGTWFYVNNSMIDWNYTGLVEFSNNLFYVQKGVLVWGYNGTTTYNGAKYDIRNSIAYKQ